MRWYVVRLNDPCSLVQRGDTLELSGDTGSSLSLNPAIDAWRSMPLINVRVADTANGVNLENPTIFVPTKDSPQRGVYDNVTNSVWFVDYFSGNVTKFANSTPYNSTSYRVNKTTDVQETTAKNPVAICFEYNSSTPSSSTIWVANYNSNNVSRISITDGTVLAQVDTGTNPIAITFVPGDVVSNNSVWTANYGGTWGNRNQVTRIFVNYTSMSSRTVNAAVNQSVIAYDPNPDNTTKYVWLGYFDSGNIAKINCTNYVSNNNLSPLVYTATVLSNVANGTYGVTDMTYAYTNWTDSAGNLTYPTMWIAGLRANVVFRINASNISANSMYFPVDLGPRGIVWDNATRKIWVTCNSQNTLNKIACNNTINGSEVTENTTNTGVNPYGVVWDSKSGNIWVSNAGDNAVQTFSPSLGTLTGTYKNLFESFYRLQRSNTGTNATESWQVVQFALLTLRKPTNETTLWRIGDSKQINWTYADSIATDEVSLMICAGTNATQAVIANYKYPINTTFTAEFNGSDGNGTYNWTIPANITNGTYLNLMNATLRVAIIDTNANLTDGRNYDYSNNQFEIIGAINNVTPSGTTLYLGQTYPINWTKAGNFNYSNTSLDTNFTIQLSVNGTNGSYGMVQVLVGPYPDEASLAKAKTALEAAGYRPVRM